MGATSVDCGARLTARPGCDASASTGGRGKDSWRRYQAKKRKGGSSLDAAPPTL